MRVGQATQSVAQDVRACAIQKQLQVGNSELVTRVAEVALGEGEPWVGGPNYVAFLATFGRDAASDAHEP
jgi:hypothetical protein